MNRDGFGIYKKDGVPTLPPTQPQPFASTTQIELDETGKPIVPKRALTREEKEQIMFFKLFDKYIAEFDLPILLNLWVRTLLEINQRQNAFSPEMENIIKRMRRIESQLNIQVLPDERLGMDEFLKAQK